MQHQPLIEEARQLFHGTPRPIDFCRNPRHCEECEEHEAVLQAHDVDNIGIEQLGSPAWDPITFASVAGFKYYFPALVRLTLQGEGESDYIESFLTHIVLDGPGNERFNSFSTEQKDFVRRLLLVLIERYADKFKEWPFLTAQFDHALRVWSEEDHT